MKLRLENTPPPVPEPEVTIRLSQAPLGGLVTIFANNVPLAWIKPKGRLQRTSTYKNQLQAMGFEVEADGRVKLDEDFSQ